MQQSQKRATCSIETIENCKGNWKYLDVYERINISEQKVGYLGASGAYLGRDFGLSGSPF